jgi:flagellar motor switch protein FliG
MQSTTFEQLTPTAAQVILAQLPERIRQALVNRAAEIDYPVEAVVEMALAGYLDSEAIGFADCKPGRGQSGD